MQLTQVQLAQIVNSAVSQALTQHIQQAASNPPLAAAVSTAAVQQVHWSIKFDVLVFEGDSLAATASTAAVQQVQSPMKCSMYPYSRVTVQQVG